jgi:hypothetical protein
MERACASCGRTLLPSQTHGMGSPVECRLCSKGRTEITTTAALADPAAAAAWRPPPPDPMDTIARLERQLDDAVRAAAEIAKDAAAHGAWKLKVDVAEEEALRTLRLLQHAADAWAEGDPVQDGFRILARAARAAADTLDATADAVQWAKKD